MTCQNCRHQKRGPMSRQGYHGCAISKLWENFAPSFTCAKHAFETPEARAVRAKGAV